jgi:phospholipase/carboxylesterase
MALESTQHAPTLASHVIAFSGKFASAPKKAPAGTAIHLIHGDADLVISVENSRNAAKQLQALGANVTLDIEPGMSHGIDGQMMAVALSKVPS